MYGIRTNGISLLIFILLVKYMHIGVLTKELDAQRLSVYSDPEICYNFTEGDKTKGEFYSPNYPNNYPNSTDCVLKLEAPYGQYVKIEFRDHFLMEYSPECSNDRLEIRDGKEGYAAELYRLCGNSVPPLITSTGNALWLRFHSDESIEYGGFKGVYSFDKQSTTLPPPPACEFNLTGESGRIEHKSVTNESRIYALDYNVPLECLWTITVPPGKKMYINFTQYKLGQVNDCLLNYIDIYGESLLESARKERFCGTLAEPIKSDSNKVHIRLYAHKKEAVEGFEFTILFTAFREASKSGGCDPVHEFDCDDGTCIHISLKCDGEANCIYRYDEDKSDCEKDSKNLTSFDSNHMVIILVLFFCLVIGMCASIVVSCWGKIKERRQRELEYKLRRSREPSVERDLDRTLTMTRLDPGLDCEYPPRGEGSLERNFVKSSTNLVDPICQEEEENGCYVPDVNMSYYRKQPNGCPSLMQEKYSPDSAHLNCLIDHAIAAECPFNNRHHPHHPHHHSQDNDNNRSGSESPIPPPPPPPALSHLRGRSARSATLPLNVSKLDSHLASSSEDNHPYPECAQHGSRSNPGDYRSASVGPPLHPASSHRHSQHPHSHPGLVGMETEDESDEKVPSISHQRSYRAEAVIQMTPSTANRPRSFVETRSAPDVIVLR